MAESWKEIAGLEGFYAVSDCGRVKALGRSVTSRWRTPKRLKAKFLRPDVGRKGHLRVTLQRDGEKVRRAFVHVLVAEAFIGPRPVNHDVCHNDNNPANNRVDNLRYDTRLGNQRDRERHGTKCQGIAHGGAKLDDESVRYIRRVRGVISQADLAVLFGVDQTTVSAVQTGRNWRHLIN